MKHPLVIMASIFGVVSCNNNSKTPVENRDSIEAITPVNKEITQCYTGIKAKDTVFLQLNKTNNNITGNLEYKRFEKDQNKGTIEGMMRGDTLLADYTFMSEGVTSIREVIFLKKGNRLVEGFGDVEEKSGKMVFKDTGTVKFDESMLLKEVDCNNK